MSVIPALGRLRQYGCEFQANLEWATLQDPVSKKKRKKRKTTKPTKSVQGFNFLSKK
jgi:hypothetical protein